MLGNEISGVYESVKKLTAFSALLSAVADGQSLTGRDVSCIGDLIARETAEIKRRMALIEIDSISMSQKKTSRVKE